MITIAQDREVVTLINSLSCEPQNQQYLINAWTRATEERLGQLPGIISAALHRSKDRTRVVNYAQWKRSEKWESLFLMEASPGFAKWRNTPNRMLTFTKSVICWTRRPASRAGRRP